MVYVPVVDLTLPEQATAASIREACMSVGFFYIHKHGVPTELVEAAFAQFRAAFALPLEEKMRIAADDNSRGYTVLQEETLDPPNQREGDTKEGFYFGREVPAGSPEASKPLHGPNQWPSEQLLPGFRSTVQAYFDALWALGDRWGAERTDPEGRPGAAAAQHLTTSPSLITSKHKDAVGALAELRLRLLRLLALALDLPADHFRPLFDPPMIMLRPLHYTTRASQPDQGVFGAGAHTDYGMLTILATDNEPGLQIRVGEEWVDVVPMPEGFIINLGDMLERWSNGRFRSTLHRVVTTGRERFSCAFFFEPNFDTVVECLPSCCSENRPPRFSPTTAGQHLLDKYAATHAGYTGPTKVDGVKEERAVPA